MPPFEQLTAALTGRYDIEREIGAGGMATVYLARDVRHGRPVALKVLKPELGAVLGVERFLSEIQVTANLQHPNLLPLFDSGEAGGLLFYVMPFVDGESLRARLDREKQLQVDEAVRLSVAIAGALEYAHQRGVIHRDLKPENILLQAGQPVIADFGIALAVSKAGGTRVTQTGLSLGTPQYMSPEQATGDRAIDARTDIYSLAAMTYEMLTGEPPHSGSTAQAIIAKLMTEEARPLTVLRRSVPPHVDAAVRHGLEKLAADRFASAAEFSLALTGARPVALTGTAAGQVARPGAQPALGRRMRMIVAALVIATVGATTTAVWLATRPTPQPVAARFELGLPAGVSLYAGGGTKLALSRDGSKIVIVGVKDGKLGLYLRHMHDPVAELIRGSDLGGWTGGNASPTFSPDGQWVAFTNNSVIMKLPASGGTAQTLADSGASVSWGDPETVAYTWQGGVYVGTPAGRDSRRVASPDSATGVHGYSWIDVLPGGKFGIVSLTTVRLGAPLDSMRLGVLSLEDGRMTELGLWGTNARYVKSGHIVFGRSPSLVLMAPFSLRTRKVTGPATVVLENAWLGTGGAGGFAVADNGTLAYHEGVRGVRSDLVVVSREGKVRRIPVEPLEYFYPRISPDGERIAVTTGIPGSRNTFLSLVDAGTGAYQRFTAIDSGSSGQWTRDGANIVFIRGTGQNEIVARAWDRSSVDTVLGRLDHRVRQIAIGPRGAFVALQVSAGLFGNDIMLAPADSLGVTRPLLPGNANDRAPSISPDGRLLAWMSDESGTFQVYVRPLPGPGPRLQVSVNGGAEPVWSPTGSTLFYRTFSRVIEAEIAGTPLKVVRRDSLFVDTYSRGQIVTNWDVFPGGREFLMIRQPDDDANRSFVVLNWQHLPSLRRGTDAAR